MSIWFCRLRKEANHKLKNLFFTFQQFNSVHIVSSSPQNHVFITPTRSTQFYINTRFYAAPAKLRSKADEKDTRLNEKITSNFIRLVVPDGAHIVISRNEALDRARRENLDLVEVQRNADPPVCKIMDYHKEQVAKQKKTKELAKTKKQEVSLKNEQKEVRFGVKIDPRDLQRKADDAKRLMENGYRVKCTVTGKENEDMGGIILRLVKLLEDDCVVESGLHLEKRQAYIMARLIKFGRPKNSCIPSKFVDAPVYASSSDASIPDDDDDDMLKSAHSDKAFNRCDVKGESTSASSKESFSPPKTEKAHPKAIHDSPRASVGFSPPSKLPVQTDNRYTRIEQRNRIQQPSTPMEGNNRRAEPQFHGQERPPRSNFNDGPKQQPAQTDSRYLRNEPRNRMYPSTPMEGNRRFEPQFRGQEMPQRPNLNVAPKQDPVQTDSRYARMEPRNRMYPSTPTDANGPPRPNLNEASPKQHKSIPDPPKSPPPSYGIFSSTPKINAFSKQGATEATNSNVGSRVNPNAPASNNEGGQKQQGGGFGIFSKR